MELGRWDSVINGKNLIWNSANVLLYFRISWYSSFVSNGMGNENNLGASTKIKNYVIDSGIHTIVIDLVSMNNVTQILI